MDSYLVRVPQCFQHCNTKILLSASSAHSLPLTTLNLFLLFLSLSSLHSSGFTVLGVDCSPRLAINSAPCRVLTPDPFLPSTELVFLSTAPQRRLRSGSDKLGIQTTNSAFAKRRRRTKLRSQAYKSQPPPWQARNDICVIFSSLF